MIRQRWVFVFALAICASGDAWAQSAGGAAAAAGASEKLVPAAMGIRSDQQGNSWNVEQNGTLGRVGSSMINSGLNLLINGNQFYTYQPLMTADGSEYVLHNRQSSVLAGLSVSRRIRVMEAEGVVRYLEVLANTTSNPIALNVTLRTNFNGNYKAYYTDEGNSSVVTLGPRESGLLVTPGSTQTNRAVLFSLCSPKSGMKPSISSQNRYGLSFQYNVQLAPGQTVCLAHAISQVPVPQAVDRRSLQRLFRPVDLDRLRATIPADLRAVTENYRRPEGAGGIAVLSTPGASSLGVARSNRSDVLALGDETRLPGAASGGELTLTNGFGSAKIPFAQVTAIEGGNGKLREGGRVFLNDGEVFLGELAVEKLQFAMAAGGRMDLEVEKLDRLVRAEQQGEGEWRAETVALVETFAGDRIALSAEESTQLTALTPWGELVFALQDILWLAPQEDDPVGYTIAFVDGTRCSAFLAGDDVAVNSLFFGKISLPVHSIRAVLSRAGRDRMAEESELTGGRGSVTDVEPVIVQPYLQLAGKQRVVGTMLDEELRLLTSAGEISVSPDEVRQLLRTNADDSGVGASRGGVDAAPGRGPQFRVELWSGGVINGHLAEPFLQVGVRGERWQVPVTDVMEMITPVPQLGEKARADITRLLGQLGAGEWQVRETATAELAALGYKARRLLESELATSKDAEVRRRLERILRTLE